ncbi:hypothetical protein Hanom_Chr11g01001241 [Helianthus anomalus]
MYYLQINHQCISIKFHDIKIICIFHYLYFHKHSCLLELCSCILSSITGIHEKEKSH